MAPPPASCPLPAGLGPALREFCSQGEHAGLIQRLEVFGSAARGTAGAGSDLDLLITFRPGALPPGLAYFSLLDELRERLAERLSRPVDLLDAAALHPPARAGSLEAAVRRDALLLYERPSSTDASTRPG